MKMKCTILIYLAFASYAAVYAERSRSVGQNNLAQKEWKLRDKHKYWHTSKSLKRANIDLMEPELHPKPIRIITLAKKPKQERTGFYRSGLPQDKSKHRIINKRNILRNKLREGYKSNRPVGVRNSPRIKYIARNQLPEPASSAMKGSQDRGREIYGNLDNIGRTFRSSSRSRKNNPEETRTEFDNANNVDELLPTSPKKPSVNAKLDVANKVSRHVEPYEDTPGSAASYPKDKQVLVYGNLDNLGITYGKTNQRVLYSQNRRNTILESLLRLLVQSSHSSNRRHKGPLVETRTDFDNENDLDEPLPANSKNPSGNEKLDMSSQVSRNVEPFQDTPESAASYPKDKQVLVYGNLDNLGITYGKTNQRVLYSQSRRNTILESLLRLLAQPTQSRDRRQKGPLIMLFYPNLHKKLKSGVDPFYASANQKDDYSGEFDDLSILPNTRRQNNESDSESDYETGSSEFEFNPANPFTIHKNRYLQNYLWNHKLTGDHVNINPYAPRFIIQGATAPELFYSRKWWYFNQDDFIPFG